MGKCSRCGRKGLFLKLDPDKHCAACQLDLRLEKTQARLNDTDRLLSEAIDSARTEAQKRLAAEEAALRQSCAKLSEDLRREQERFSALQASNEEAQKSLTTALHRTEKLKPLANSIKAAAQSYADGDIQNAYAQIAAMGIDDLLPQPDLNCLTVKELKSRYNALRKQIVDLCGEYESRYTTKTNAALYKLMVLALESELENILYKLQFGKRETGIAAVRELTTRYYVIASDGNQSIAPTLKRFIAQIESLYLEVIDTEYEYYVQRERAREEQRAIKEQMRQESEERKRLEQERKHVEAEEKKYRLEIERITAQMQHAHNTELETLRKRLAEMNSLIGKVEEKKAEIINLQNGKAGTVYIISNIGSFGDHVFKVGMTRRLEPQERVNELGDASVPFPFDVHSFIFSEDAVALETALHKELNDRRVNKVNLRKEFFDITIEELQALVERIDPTAPFKVTALAEQYRQSLSIEKVPVNSPRYEDEAD